MRKEVPVVDGSPVFEDLSPHRNPYRRVGGSPRRSRRQSPRRLPSQRKLDYTVSGRGTPGTVRSLRDREREWLI